MLARGQQAAEGPRGWSQELGDPCVPFVLKTNRVAECPLSPAWGLEFAGTVGPWRSEVQRQGKQAVVLLGQGKSCLASFKP